MNRYQEIEIAVDKTEVERLKAVHSFLEIDFEKRKEFQDIVDLAARLCNKPVALITLLDENENWIKVRSGVNHQVMPRRTSFCQYAINQDEMTIIPDTVQDHRFDDNDLVHQDPNVRFYAGAPLALGSGLKLGTLCLFDVTPGNLDEIQKSTLTVLARQVVFLMELELSRQLLEKQMQDIKAKNESLIKIAYIQSHNIRQPLTSIMALVNLIKDGYQEVNEEWIHMISEATNTLDQRIHEIVKESLAEKDIKALRFNKMVEEIEDYAILLLDRNGNVENWNKGAEILKGYKAHEIIGKNFSVFYTHPDLVNKVPESLIQQAVMSGVAKNEGWRLRKDGSRFWGSILITAIHNDSGEVIGFTKVTRLLANDNSDTGL
ncbi:PAS domain S-box protein [Dyadobacter flavalbus]|uniref:histidine kinase n=1 Tax=Dyadobacter flavalbus TaxID=2579942 RepID=A0A5M8QTV6_9BACT|nr:PAS domain S-box protein [Dyadobacter flavalbus]KAA6438460.1 PAS domain S-box protein [Dyadobacter flavalbus]